MYEILKTLNFREIVGYAIGSEDAANKYYLDLSKKVNELTAVRFENLARDEAAHKKVLLDLHKQLFGDENYVMPEGVPPFESSVKVDSVDNLIVALGNAMLNEYNAYKVYKYLAKHHKEHRALFEYLAVMERGHYETLKMEKELYEDRTIVDPKIKALPAYNWTKFQ
jgi:rubrerythrin